METTERETATERPLSPGGHPDARSNPTSAGPDPAVTQHDYRSLVTFPADGCALPRIQEQLTSWLRGKGFALVDLGQSGFHATERGDLLVAHRDSATGHDFRARLTEINGSGRWTTELTCHLPTRSDGWLTLHVGNDRGRSAEVPRLAGYLLDVLDAYDGATPMPSQAPVVGIAGVEEFLDMVCDPDRHGLLIVAGTSAELPFSDFVDKVRFWTGGVAGLAHAVVLDPPATAQFAAMVGTAHAVSPWTLRSYQPAADPAWAPDARRHKVLGTDRLARDPDRVIRALLARAARVQASQRPLPTSVTRVYRDLARLEDRLFVDSLFAPKPADEGRGAAPASAATPAPPAPPAQRSRDTAEPAVHTGEPDTAPVSADTNVAEGSPEAAPASGVGAVADQAASYLAQLELTRQLLGIDQVDEQALTEIAALLGRARRDAASVDRITRELAARQQRIADLEDEVAFHKELYSEEELYRVVAEDERSRAEDEARWLRQQLREQGNFLAAAAAMPAEGLTQHPASFDELLTRLPDLEPRGLVFTGDPEVVRGLDDVDGNGKLVRAAWEALLVLGDYVTARRNGAHDHGVTMYLDKTPSGYRPLSPKKHAPKETESTMNQWGWERFLPVPDEVSPTGRACMEAHFKLGRVGTVSPRMHYLDDVARSGNVYVGYIGPHLTTAATN